MRTEQEKKNSQKITDFADKTLLIVDDDNPLRDRLARAMEKKGFQVAQADSVQQGITKAKNSPPAFVCAQPQFHPRRTAPARTALGPTVPRISTA